MPETQYAPVPMDDLADALETARQAKALSRQWAEVAESAMAPIKERIRAGTEATIDGRPVLRCSERTVTRVNTKALRAEVPAEVLAPYLTTTVEVRYDMVAD